MDIPDFFCPIVKLPQPDGSLLVKAGRPQAAPAFVSVTQFHKATGVSKRHIATLCEQGLIEHRRLTPKNGSKILIPRAEIGRYLALDDEASKMPQDDFTGIRTPKNESRATYPSARLGRMAQKRQSTPQNK